MLDITYLIKEFIINIIQIFLMKTLGLKIISSSELLKNLDNIYLRLFGIRTCFELDNCKTIKHTYYWRQAGVLVLITLAFGQGISLLGGTVICVLASQQGMLLPEASLMKVSLSREFCYHDLCTFQSLPVILFSMFHIKKVLF